MTILADRNTRVLVQGITGREGAFHTAQMVDYGTTVVAGVTPGRAGESVAGVPVFDTVRDAVAATDANASVIFVPGPYCADAILEAADAGIPLIVVITEGVPAREMTRVSHFLAGRGITLVGPNTPGLITPDQAKLGIIPGHIVRPGPVGVASRSGTLTYEVLYALSQRGIGQSTAVGMGGDAVPGTTFVDLLTWFEADPQTEVIVLIGEIGGTEEERAAEFVRQHVSKPVVAFVAGRTAPPGKRMGHAGAIIAGGTGTAEAKISALTAAGVAVAAHPDEITDLVAGRLAQN